MFFFNIKKILLVHLSIKIVGKLQRGLRFYFIKIRKISENLSCRTGFIDSGFGSFGETSVILVSISLLSFVGVTVTQKYHNKITQGRACLVPSQLDWAILDLF